MATATSTTRRTSLALSWPSDVPSLVWSCIFAVLVVAACVLRSDEFHHGFIVPVLLCGILIGVDAVDWLRSRCDVFDPVGLIGVLGIHFYFLAPLLHVGTQYWMGYIEPPADWRVWLEAMGWLNVAGLLIYRVSLRLLNAKVQPIAIVRRSGEPSRNHAARLAAPIKQLRWQLNTRWFVTAMGVALAATALLQLVVYARFGGIGGYVEAYTESADNFTGYGLVFMFSEAFPILAAIAAAYWASRDDMRRTWPVVLSILVGFILLKFIFGGLRGSRGHLIYGLFWAVGIVHLVVRPLPKRMFAVGGLFLVLFMYGYGFYKSFGADAVQALDGSAARAELLESSTRTLDAVVLGDLARSDVQAFELYRLTHDPLSTYELTWGETYLGAVSVLIPRSLLADRWPTKIKAGTDLLFGEGVYESDMIGTNAYGLAGEAMLNFGPLGALLSFVMLALVVVVVQRWSRAIARGDSRQYIAPFVVSLVFMVLIWDSDVVVFYTIKEGLLPALVLLVGSQRVIAAQPAAGSVAA